MSITKQQFAGYVKDFNLRELFIDGLFWNNDHTAVQPLEVDGVRFAPKIIADKNGFKIIECANVSVPLYAARIHVLNALKSRFAELLVIFTDHKQTRQVWLYGYKDSGQNKKAECEFRAGQDPQALYERAAGLFFSLDEEGNITILDVIGRVRDSFTANAERVTKRFYNEFKTQHTALLGFIQGITETVDKEWYASIMLNRLMFCYFMQKRGFLDKNRNYLRDKLMESKEKLGKGKFYSFYRSFLMILFKKGFGTYEHSPEIKAMIGDIPYLNGGLFDLHEIEKNYPNIDISDEAFERIFILFDRYEWHLDTRECASGDEISPDVLGYIFEKYINDRAAMGAYYTQEDITGYIEQEMQNALQCNFMGLTKISETMDAMLHLSKAVSRYKQLQLGQGDYREDDFKAAKDDLSTRQANLRAQLDKLLRDNDYGNVDDGNWQNNYQPFHWVSEFYSIIAENGGFDVIIGNPPYVEYSKVRKQYTLDGYETLSCGNLYAFVIERNTRLMRDIAYSGMIVPHSAFCTDCMENLIKLFKKTAHWVSSFDVHPSKLFDGVEQRLAIYIVKSGEKCYTSKYNRWNAEARVILFESIAYIRDKPYIDGVISKNQNAAFFEIFDKIKAESAINYNTQSVFKIYYHNAPRYWIRATEFVPYFCNDKSGESLSTQIKVLSSASKPERDFFLGLLNSSLYYLWFIAFSDSRHLNVREISSFPHPKEYINRVEYYNCLRRLMTDYKANRYRKSTYYASTGNVEYDEYFPKLSKPIIDEIDTILAEHYGFTEEELDYIINYDIKYRMGLGGAAEGSDEE